MIEKLIEEFRKKRDLAKAHEELLRKGNAADQIKPASIAYSEIICELQTALTLERKQNG